MKRYGVFTLPVSSSSAVAGLCAQPQAATSSQAATTPQPATQAITLNDALRMAQANNVPFRAAQADAALAKEDRVQARATLLPGVSYNNQFLYTEGNGTGSGRFIANNGVHEYVSQGNASRGAQLCSRRPTTGEPGPWLRGRGPERMWRREGWW